MFTSYIPSCREMIRRVSDGLFTTRLKIGELKLKLSIFLFAMLEAVGADFKSDPSNINTNLIGKT